VPLNTRGFWTKEAVPKASRVLHVKYAASPVFWAVPSVPCMEFAKIEKLKIPHRKQKDFF